MGFGTEQSLLEAHCTHEPKRQTGVAPLQTALQAAPAGPQCCASNG